MIRVLYWAFVAVDAAALLFFFVLGLAAAGSARTHPASVALLMLVLPALPLLVSVWVFHRSASAAWRGAAFALVAAPLCVLFAIKLATDGLVSAHSNAAGELTFFRPGPQRELVDAIQRNDAAAVAARARPDTVNQTGLEGMTLLVMAMRQLRTVPTQVDVLRALLAAGADPNLGTAHEWPLEMALQGLHRTGPVPLTLLLKQGADPNRKNAFGHPVYFAGAGHGKAEQTLATLLDHGADLRATGPGGETVLFYAASASNWRAMDFLLTRGADPRQGRSRTGQTLRDVVEDAARQRQARGVQGGRASDDDGLQDLLTRLKGV
jgi:ankyrin repeat protein